MSARGENTSESSRPAESGQVNNELVSIVIPTCNRPEVTLRCLQAIAGLNKKNFEVVVIDDCSTDHTPEMLREFGESNPQLRYRWLRNEKNIGANPSRNRALAETTGELVCLLDCDSLVAPDWLDRIISPFDSDNVAAVNGLVLDVPPRNLFELTLKGNHRVHGKQHASRLVSCNMCVRRELLIRYGFDEDRAKSQVRSDGTPDVAVSGRGDEEGLYLRLKAAGYEIRLANDAVITHDHPISGRTFLRQAFRGGRSAARLVYKYELPQRLDMLPFLLAVVTLPLGLAWQPLFLMSGFFFLAGVGAIVYNDLCRKKKTIVETAVTFPLMLIYYGLRLCGYLSETIRLRVRKHEITRVDPARIAKGSE